MNITRDHITGMVLGALAGVENDFDIFEIVRTLTDRYALEGWDGDDLRGVYHPRLSDSEFWAIVENNHI